MAGAAAAGVCGATAVAGEEAWGEAGVGVAGAAGAGAGAVQGAVQGAAELGEAAEAGVRASSSRLRFEAAVVGEAPAAAPLSGRGAGVGVLPCCVASESDSDWSAWFASTDGPAPCDEGAGGLLPDGATCGAESCTGAASVKMPGAQPSSMNCPSPPAVAAAAAAASGVLKPPLWYAALPTGPVAHLEHRSQLEKTAKPWYGDQ